MIITIYILGVFLMGLFFTQMGLDMEDTLIISISWPILAISWTLIWLYNLIIHR